MTPHRLSTIAALSLAVATSFGAGCRTVGSPASPESLAAPVAAQASAPAAAQIAAGRQRPPAAETPELRLTKPTRYPVRQTAYDPPAMAAGRGRAPVGLPPGASASIPSVEYAPGCPPGCPPGVEGPWSPDGLARPWPIDEYIWDGGDRDTLVEVGRDWTVRGLDQEDTVAHYDTVDGRVQVTPSNKVPIYAPRFAAVRQLHGAEMHLSRERLAEADRRTRLQSQDRRTPPVAAAQPVQVVREHNLRSPVLMRDQTRGLPIAMSLLPHGFERNFLPYEDLSIIKRGQYDASEKARLAERTRAALTWTTDQMAQAVIDGVVAHLAEKTVKPGETLQYEMPPGKPRLRLVKVASKSEAAPGEEVDFTLRFDNVGDQKIGNVTIVDSLTTRLEFVEGSTSCTLPAKFGTQDNEADSLVLRWEIDEPLEPGQGGVIRFKCRLR